MQRAKRSEADPTLSYDVDDESVFDPVWTTVQQYTKFATDIDRLIHRWTVFWNTIGKEVSPCVSNWCTLSRSIRWSHQSSRNSAFPQRVQQPNVHSARHRSLPPPTRIERIPRQSPTNCCCIWVAISHCHHPVRSNFQKRLFQECVCVRALLLSIAILSLSIPLLSHLSFWSIVTTFDLIVIRNYRYFKRSIFRYIDLSIMIDINIDIWLIQSFI